jgi:branched-chain amino acid transport system permease protein
MSMRWIGVVSLWTGLLILPFTGPWKAVLLGGSVLAGGLAWKWIYSLSRQTTVGESLKGIAPSLGWIQGFCQKPLAKYLGLAAVLFVPPFLNNYAVDVLTLTGIYVVLALGLNIVVGLAGLLDLGYIAFYAIGAYTYALLSVHYGVSFWIGMPLGGMAAAAFGIMLGLVTLRLRGDYLAIVTLGFIQIVHLVLNNWDSVTNGPNGILNIGRPMLGDFELQQPIHFYYLILAIALVTLGVVSRLNQSRVGRAWIAIREDEVAAASMGIPTTRFKVLAFTLGAAWAGIAGSFFAAKFAFISPESFTFFESVFVLSMVVLGGMGSMAGAILGASLLVILPEFLRGLADYRMLFFGMLLVLLMIFRPQGLLPGTRRKIQTETK